MLPNRIDKSSHSDIIIVTKQGNFPLRSYHVKHLYVIVSPVSNYNLIIAEKSNAILQSSGAYLILLYGVLILLGS